MLQVISNNFPYSPECLYPNSQSPEIRHDTFLSHCRKDSPYSLVINPANVKPYPLIFVFIFHNISRNKGFIYLSIQELLRTILKNSYLVSRISNLAFIEAISSGRLKYAFMPLTNNASSTGSSIGCSIISSIIFLLIV